MQSDFQHFMRSLSTKVTKTYVIDIILIWMQLYVILFNFARSFTVRISKYLIYTILLCDLSDTHRRCKELLEQNGFIVTRPLVLCLRNAFEIAMRQTIKRYYRLQQLELPFVLQIEWCIIHHIRAQYIETTLQCTEMKYEY